MALLFMLLALLSGSVVGAVKWRIEFEKTIALTPLFMVTIMYVFGLLGILKYGVMFIAIAVTSAYAYVIIELIRKRTLRILAPFYTPGFFAFCAIAIIIIYANYGKVAEGWDEFSHWMDCIKAMVYVDDFVDNPAAHSAFQSYPPGLCLLQYFFQKIYMFFTHGLYSEWLMYVVFQLFVVSIFMPLLSVVKIVKKFESIVLLFSLFAFPLLLFQSFWSRIDIDAFLAILMACGLAVYIFQKDKILKMIYVNLICVNLVLAKDVGLYFALALSLYVMTAEAITIYKKKENMAYSFWFCVIPMVSTIVAKWLWALELKMSGAIIRFSNEIDMVNYIKMIFFQNDTSYRQEVVNNYLLAPIRRREKIGGVNIRYMWLMLGTGILALVIIILAHKLIKNVYEQRVVIFSAIFMILLEFLWIFSMGGMYAYKFSEYEAKNLASYNRYMNIILEALYLYYIIALLFLATKVKRTKSIAFFPYVFILLVLLVSPEGRIKDYFSREMAKRTIATREPYLPLANLISNHCGKEDDIFFLSRGDSGFDFWIVRYLARPAWVHDNSPSSWSLGPAVNGSDIWSVDLTLDEWTEVLFEGDYEYVAIFDLGDDFIEQYGLLFESPENVTSNSLYFFDKEDMILRGCENGQ